MKRYGFMVAASILFVTVSALAQEVRNEVSAQGTGFFTKDSTNNGITRSTTDNGGFLVGYRYHFNKWLAAEANYGFDRDTQKYFSSGGFSRVQSDIHATTADLVVNLPVRFYGLRPYVLGGSGALTFHPTGWDRELFAQGVVVLAFEDLLTPQRRIIMTNRAVNLAEATVDIREMQK
jgi:hypothetical protein